MNFPRCQCPLVIAFLSITMAARTSTTNESAYDQRSPPFWQFVLREFVFKTLSSSRHRNDDLYKKLQDAPFYGGRLAVASNDANAVISRGRVYSAPDGQWILCQDGCANCEPCKWRADEPAVTWTLRRVKRWTSPGSPKWDLRLTVVPQMDGSFRTGGRRGRDDQVSTMSRDQTDAQGAHDSVTSGTRQNVAYQKAQRTSFASPNGANRYLNGEQSNVGIRDEYRRGTGPAKRYRSRRRLPADSYEPDGDARNAESWVELPEDDLKPRLIVGIDQNGKKHLVHLVPVDPSWGSTDGPNDHATSYRPTYKRENIARVSRTIQERDSALYDKLIEKIVDSFDTHRNFVERFLYSDRIESENHGEAPVPSYSSYPESEAEDFEGRNLEGYRIDDARQVNQYPSGAGYQVSEEETDEFRRHPDLRQEVNKPYGEYQDQNTMIEYEPYGLPAEGQKQQQQHQNHQNERFLTLADVERKRRNSFAKLMDSTAGHQPLSQNHTQTDASDTEFPMKRDFRENSTNQPLASFQPKIDVTGTRMR